MATRYPAPFQLRATSSRNIASLGPMPRALARTHAHALAAWLVTIFGDMDGFTEVLLDVWVARYGIEQTPGWLLALHPNWRPYEPPIQKAILTPVRDQSQPAQEAARPRPIVSSPAPGAAPPVARSGGGGGNLGDPPRFLGPDGQALDAEALRRIAAENARVLAERANGGAAALPMPMPVSAGEVASEGGEGEEAGDGQ